MPKLTKLPESDHGNGEHRRYVVRFWVKFVVPDAWKEVGQVIFADLRYYTPWRVSLPVIEDFSYGKA